MTRKHLEPSVAVRIHHGLGLPRSAMNFDIANACLGFVNGMALAGQLIDSGQIDYAVIIDGEDADEIQVNTIERLGREGIKRKDFMSEFASLTLGSGAAAAVIGRADLHPEGHRMLGGITRAATQFNDLCVGSVDGMFTDAKALLKGGMELVVSAWKEREAQWSWSHMDRYIMHQVSSCTPTPSSRPRTSTPPACPSPSRCSATSAPRRSRSRSRRRPRSSCAATAYC